ncbi:MAG: HigA family addiction module antidote protein [Alphaproteobacteria bacterium]|nr:HigA family addiction module antidote protein [Alphaproteobacteria bacterium]
MSKNSAAELHVPANRISAIFHGTRGITADTAMRLGRTFNTTAEFWLNLQTTHDLTKAQAEVGAEIERRVRRKTPQLGASLYNVFDLRRKDQKIISNYLVSIILTSSSSKP